MKLIDSHLHLWDLGKFPCSWCAGIPALNRNFLLPDYLGAAEGTGIGAAVFVECDVDEPHAAAEARHIQELADATPHIAGIVAAARPEHPCFPEQLEELLRLPKLRGIRRVLHVVPDETSQSPLFSQNLRRLAAHKLTFDLCVLARQLPLAIALAKKCPEVQFILDHCGVPDIKGGAIEPWRSHIKEIASLPNVACKISGIVAYASPDWTPSDLRPWVGHVVDCFGWNRVLWGGDWPVCTLASTLRRWVDTCDELFARASESERENLFHKNAVTIYSLPAL